MPSVFGFNRVSERLFLRNPSGSAVDMKKFCAPQGAGNFAQPIACESIAVGSNPARQGDYPAE